MQIYALGENGLIPAISADKGKNYFCPECFAHVRVRQGDLRQSHFFHLNQNFSCRQSQKGKIHLRLQRFVNYLFPDAEMEKAFFQIGRIADVADEHSKMVYEIQYSPITLEEAKQRCLDYESLDYRIVWILHDDTFNQKKVTPAEQFLRSKTCYFSNMDEGGNGAIYDQLERIIGKKRVFISHRKRVLLRHCYPLPPFKWPRELALRGQSWTLYHKHDLMDMALRGKFFPPKLTPQRSLWQWIKDVYFTWLYILLERSSR